MEKSFRYMAVDIKGSKISGSIRADSSRAVSEMIRTRGLIPLDIKEERLPELFSKKAFLKILTKIGLRQYSSRDIMNFCYQLSSMLQAGVSIIHALKTISVQMENRVFKNKVEAAAAAIEEGSDFASALKQQDSFFPPLMINMIAAGEASGMLDSIMERIAEHYEKQHDLEEKIRSATAYPLFITVVALVVILIMVIFVLPQFSGIFSAVGMDMPIFSRIMLAAGEFILAHRYFLLAIIFVCFLLLKYSINTKKGRLYADYLRLSLPLIGKIYCYITAARFARTLGTLLTGGVSLHNALHIVGRVIDNSILTTAISELSTALNNGETLSAPMAGQRCFPPLLVEMVRVGEETGSLDHTLERAAKYYEKEVSYIVERLGTMLEPLLLLAVGLFIGLLVFSVLSPMYLVFELL
ncbi:MAG: type II secretion system F family protein [Bacillota bacterium]